MPAVVTVVVLGVAAASADVDVGATSRRSSVLALVSVLGAPTSWPSTMGAICSMEFDDDLSEPTEPARDGGEPADEHTSSLRLLRLVVVVV